MVNFKYKKEILPVNYSSVDLLLFGMLFCYKVNNFISYKLLNKLKKVISECAQIVPNNLFLIFKNFTFKNCVGTY